MSPRLRNWNPFLPKLWQETSGFVAVMLLLVMGVFVADRLLGEAWTGNTGDDSGPFTTPWVPVTLGLGLVALVSVMAASAIGRQQNLGTLDLVRVSPRGPKRLLYTLMLAPISQLVLIAAIGFVSCWLLFRHEMTQADVWGLGLMWGTTVLYGTAFSLVGVTLSTLTRRPTRAMLATLFLLIALCLANLFAGWISAFLSPELSSQARILASYLSPFEHLWTSLSWTPASGIGLPISLIGYLVASLLMTRFLIGLAEPLMRRAE